jgi:hypothetical protein
MHAEQAANDDPSGSEGYDSPASDGAGHDDGAELGRDAAREELGSQRHSPPDHRPCRKGL